MQTITEIIADLSIDIACLLDEPSEVTEQDLIKIQDLITKLDNQETIEKQFEDDAEWYKENCHML